MISQRPELLEFVVQTRSPTVQAEFVTDPEESPLGQANFGLRTEPSSSSSATKSLPLLLLRVSAGEEMRFDFDLRGQLLDSLWHRQQRDRNAQSTENSQGKKSQDLDQENHNREQDQSQNQNQDQEQNKNESIKQSPHLDTRIGHNNDQAENAAMQSVTNARPSSANDAPEDDDEAQESDWQHIVVNTNVYFVETRSEQTLQSLLEQETLLQQQVTR